jgi:phosphate transport system substrate-binding protein
MHRIARVALALSIIAGATHASADQVGADTHFCDGKGQPAVGEGSLSQLLVHVQIFAPQFSRVCPAEGGMVRYLGTGDARGIASLQNRARDFAGADVALSTTEKALTEANARVWSSPVHQIPLYVDGWAIAYNVPCNGPRLKLSSLALSLMYSGVITSWDDDRLVADNPWLATCDETVRLIRRLDNAGATTVFQDYLSKQNPQWNAYKRGVAGTSWPTNAFACAGQGDEGMVNCLRSVAGGIAYVEFAPAFESGLPLAAVQNVTRSFVAPTTGGCSAAASAAVTPPGTAPQSSAGATAPWLPGTTGDWSAVTITDAPDAPSGAKSYPICSFSYAFVLQDWFSGYGGTVGGGVTRSVVDYFWVALMDGTQAKLSSAGYAPLPANVREVARAGVLSISYFYFTTAGV